MACAVSCVNYGVNRLFARISTRGARAECAAVRWQAGRCGSHKVPTLVHHTHSYHTHVYHTNKFVPYTLVPYTLIPYKQVCTIRTSLYHIHLYHTHKFVPYTLVPYTLVPHTQVCTFSRKTPNLISRLHATSGLGVRFVAYASMNGENTSCQYLGGRGEWGRWGSGESVSSGGDCKRREHIVPVPGGRGE